MADNQKISSRQAAWILAFDILAVGLFGLPALFQGDTLGNILSEGALTLVLAGLYEGASIWWLRHADRERACHDTPAALHSLIQIFFFVYYLFAAVYAVEFFWGVIDHLVVAAYRYPVTILFFLAVVVYGAGKGMEVRARTAELLGWLVFIPFIFLFILGFWQMIGKTTPAVTTMQWQAIWTEGYKGLFLFWLGDHPLLINRYIQWDRKFYQRLLYGLIGGSLIVFAGLLLTGLYLTPEGMLRESEPFAIVLQMIRFPGNFISRYDVFFVMLWMMSFYILVSGMMIYMVDMTAGLTQISGRQPEKRWIALGCGLVILTLATIVHACAPFQRLFQSGMWWAGIPLSVLIVVIGGCCWKKVVNKG